jgi:hypothetical protein
MHNSKEIEFLGGQIAEKSIAIAPNQPVIARFVLFEAASTRFEAL